jgi:hypothetical protein
VADPMFDVEFGIIGPSFQLTLSERHHPTLRDIASAKVNTREGNANVIQALGAVYALTVIDAFQQHGTFGLLVHGIVARVAPQINSHGYVWFPIPILHFN